MEQWVCDGRTMIRDRGMSLVPSYAEQEGFVDVTQGLRGMLKRTHKRGADDGAAPQVYAECLCNYTYWTVDGLVADCSDDGHPLEVLVGAGQVTQGFDEALAAMTLGEISEFWLDPAFAFRENGMKTLFASDEGRGSVKADEPVRLQIELVRFFNPMNSIQKLARAHELKDEGTSRFKDGAIEEALGRYHDGLRKLGAALSLTSREQQEMTAEGVAAFRDEERVLKSVLCSNIATCWFLKGDNDKCLSFCERALASDKCNAKALFRTALVLEKRCEFDKCVEILTTMEQRGVGVSADILAMRQRILDKNVVQTAAQNNVYKKMFWGSENATT